VKAAYDVQATPSTVSADTARAATPTPDDSNSETKTKGDVVFVTPAPVVTAPPVGKAAWAKLKAVSKYVDSKATTALIFFFMVYSSVS
jgi:hypothetical protein